MSCDRATNGSTCDDNFAGDAERIEQRNHAVTDPANIECAVRFFKLQYRRDFVQSCASCNHSTIKADFRATARDKL